MKLSRITSEFSYGDWIIHKFGVKEDGTPVHAKSQMRDWFYFKADQIGQLSIFDKIDIDIENPYRSIYGDECYKIEYTSIKVKNRIEKAFPEYIYESDVRPEFKYLMQTKNLKWADASDRNVGYWDIETFTEDDEFIGPDNPIAPITSIQIYSSRSKKYYIFTWHETETEHLTVPTIKKKDDKVYVFCKDEIDVIVSFFEFLHEQMIDVLVGWYSKQFDLPYICQRCGQLGLDYNLMSPVGRVSHYNRGFEWKTYIDGIDHIDMMDAIKEVGYNLPNNKLSTAMKEILKDPDIEKLTDVTWRDWRDDYAGFMRYGLRDVEGVYKIDQALGIIDLFCTIQKITNITQLNDISFKSSVVDKFILTECNGQFVLPTRVTSTKEEYMGAHVLDSKPGLYKDVGIVDYASLYPTTVMSFNLSPETLITSQREVDRLGLTMDQVIAELKKKRIEYIDTGYSDELVGKRYLYYSQKSKVGVVPKILKKMYKQRVEIKKHMKIEQDPVIKNALDKHQYALKIILNSAYGAFGFNFFRLYKIEVADSITYFARKALHYAIDDLTKNDFEVIYGDTDSCFFVHAGKDVKSWLNGFNFSLVTDFIPTYNSGPEGEYMLHELEYEKDMERIYFGDSKKRYYGIERNTGKKYIKGLNIIRKDAPSFLKDRLNQLTEKAVLKTLSLSDIISLREEIESQPYETIGVTKAFGQPFDKFKNKANHVEGAKFANEILGTRITHKDTPLLFYITSFCEDDKKPKDRHKTICLLSDDLHLIDKTKLFKIDYDTYFNKQVMEQLKEFKHIPEVQDVLEQYKEKIKNEICQRI